jgi:hypothetical protein
VLGLSESGPNRGGKAAVPAQVVAERRCIIHLFLRHAAPVQRMPRVQGQFADKLALGPPVPFTERVQAIQLAQIGSSPVDEWVDGKAF